MTVFSSIIFKYTDIFLFYTTNNLNHRDRQCLSRDCQRNKAENTNLLPELKIRNVSRLTDSLEIAPSGLLWVEQAGQGAHQNSGVHIEALHYSTWTENSQRHWQQCVLALWNVAWLTAMIFFISVQVKDGANAWKRKASRETKILTVFMALPWTTAEHA